MPILGNYLDSFPKVMDVSSHNMGNLYLPVWYGSYGAVFVNKVPDLTRVIY
jgi:hypothetical protein